MDTMTSAKVEVLWSPVHHNKFIIWGPDITLYEVGRIKEIEKKTSFVSISSTRGASVVASHSAHGVRCLDLSAIPDLQDPLLALGYANGRVGLTTLKQMFDPMGFAGRVFAPKYPRLCNSVSWSHSETNMLAVAMEKHRSDHCILIWDVHRDTLPWSDVNDASPPEQPRPLAEMGLSETAHSVSWANCGYRTLVASMNLKYIKVFDLRDWSNKAVSSTGRGQWSGALAAPAGWQLAARADAGVALWDLRHMQRPLLTLHHPKPVAALHWCPTRRNLLLTLQKDSSSVRLYDIQQAHNDTKNSSASSSSEVLVAPAIEADVEEYSRGGTSGDGAGVLEREVTPAPGALALLAAAWHPAHEARLLAVCANGSIVDYTVCERVTVAWGGGHGGAGALAWTGGGGVLNVMNDDFYSQVKDISHVMKKRAQTDYGLKPDLWQNADLAEDESVSAMWHFLALSKSLVEDGCIRGSPWRHPGVLGVLGRAEGGYRSEGGVLVVGDVPARRVAVYRSAERARALQLCGWGWGWDSCAAGVERAEAEGTPCRAAALAAFHLRVRAALDVLGRAREPQLRVVALALAGLGDERLWRDALAAARPALPDAYLRALLAFLAATQPAAAAPAPADYAGVLAETEMRLEDRVAFACVYLCDARLHEFLARTADALTRRGELAGLLLTGLAPEGVALLAAWVARTHDVQTAALVAARCATPDLLHHHTVQQWLDSYRLLLDSWQLWWARCALDTWVRQGAGAEPEGRQVAVACTYCGKSVAAPPPRPGVRPTLARLPPPAAKMKQTSSCPSCRKPLPRCAVCGLHLGTAAGGAPFAGWFSWCVACRHGGHAAHLIEWFSEHTECPVSSCNCHCSTLDPPDRHC